MNKRYIENQAQPPKIFLQSENFNTSIAHGFFTRALGNQNDIPACLEMGEAPMVFPRQTHSTTILVVSNDNLSDLKGAEADALVSKEKNIILGVVTADCLPILLHDSENHIIAAIHAGWRGALDGVLENTVKAMKALGAETEHIHAVIGPAIGFSSYEVGAEFRQNFLEKHTENKIFFKEYAKKFLFDLKSFAKRSLQQSGIKACETLPFDTWSDESLFFSYRRSLQNNRPTGGRNFSAIGQLI